MQPTKLRAVFTTALCLLLPGLAIAQSANPASSIIVPNSSIALRADAGIRAHTNLLAILPATGPRAAATTSGPPFPGFLYQTPASIACIYGLVPAASGCNPNLVTKNPTGGSKAIAIVDAYDDPKALNDLKVFSAQFGVPFNQNDFTVVYANASGTRPPLDPTGSWELEESLDIEWAHAMAPNAQGYQATFGYDFCTGVGSPRGYSGK